jgi:xanthine dehydrogenase YagT iron-sulfur-binding subunit
MSDQRWELNRRDFVKTAGAITGAAVITVPPSDAGHAPSRMSMTLRINGKPYSLMVDPRMTLLDLLRETLGLTGTKKGCDHGQCGACTVLVNGRRINSCLSLALANDGETITTIEGLAAGDQLHPLQSAFIECDGLQCGYCTPGQICSAVGLLREAAMEHTELTDDEIRERMSGNICRCGAYPGIVEAIHKVYRQSRADDDAASGRG